MVAGVAFALLVKQASIQADIQLAMKLWLEFDMPIPSPSAKLYLENSNGRLVFYGYAEGDKKKGLAYAGAQSQAGGFSGYSLKEWDTKKPISSFASPYSYNIVCPNGFQESTIVSVAVQSALLANFALAESIVERESKDLVIPYWGAWGSKPEPWVGTPKDASLAANTAFLIYSNLLNQAADPSSDRQMILRKFIDLEKYHLITKGPPHHLGGGQWGIEDRIKEFSATVNLPSDKNSEIQKAVNQLVDLRRHEDFEIEKTPLGKKILSFGIAAIPALANELDQPRLTRILNLSMGNDLTQIIPTKYFVWTLIQSIAGKELSSRRAHEKQSVLNWYKAKTSGQWDSYLLSTVVDRYSNFIDSDSSSFSLILNHHPHLLKEAIIKLRNAGADAGWDYAKLADSSLPQAQKKELLIEASKGDNLANFTSSIDALRQVDEKEAEKLLLRFISLIPQRFDRKFSAVSKQLLFSESPEVWTAFETAFNKAGIDMKMHLVQGLRNSPKADQSPNPYAMRFLVHLFSDGSKASSEYYDEQMNWAKGQTLGQTALRIAAIASNHLKPEMSLTDELLLNLRKKIEAEYPRGN